MPSHRADRPAVVRRRRADPGTLEQGSTGRALRRSGTHVLQRRSGRLRAALPAAVGATALTLAAVGPLTVDASEAGSAAPATVLVPTARPASSDAARRLLSGREQVVSRDSRRAEVADAADKDLQAVAEKQARKRNAALAQLAASAEKQAGLIAESFWQLPVTPPAYHLTSRFGQCSGLWSHCHTGLDFAAPTGTPIHAVAHGTITEAGPSGAYGNRTIQTLEDGTELWYCHQSAVTVSVGQRVTPGTVIGAVGATGNTTGPHLHLEVRPGAGDPEDPFAALVAHGLHP